MIIDKTRVNQLLKLTNPGSFYLEMLYSFPIMIAFASWSCPISLVHATGSVSDICILESEIQECCK